MKNEFDEPNEKEEKDMKDLDETRKDKYYTEINIYRRHYSQLRFAIFPLYLAIQAGLLRFSFSCPAGVNTFIPSEYLFSFGGILITYVFWTIESGILRYYKYLYEAGSLIEQEYPPGHNLITGWPDNSKHSLLTNTTFAIRLTFLLSTAYWLGAAIYFWNPLM